MTGKGGVRGHRRGGGTGGPLRDVRVLDFSRFVSGPYATMLLADNGADVIKVEPIGGEATRRLDPKVRSADGREGSVYYARLNRSKQSVCINLRTSEGRRVTRRLVRSADVLVENFRPAVMTRLGLGWESLRRLNRGLVYCSISGYGHTPSPKRDLGGLAIVAETEAGLLGRPVRLEDPPVRVGAPIGDLYPAALAVGGIAMALVRRAEAGIGAHVDIAMHDALLSLNENALSRAATTGEETLPVGDPNYAFPFGYFRAGRSFVSVAVLGEDLWQRLCTVMGRGDLAVEPRMSSGARRYSVRAEIQPLLEEWLCARGPAKAVDMLCRAGIPAAIVPRRAKEILESQQVAARGMLVHYPTYFGVEGTAVANPIRVEPGLSAPAAEVAGPGANTVQVLRDVGGYTGSEIASLLRRGVVSQWHGEEDEIDQPAGEGR